MTLTKALGISWIAGVFTAIIAFGVYFLSTSFLSNENAVTTITTNAVSEQQRVVGQGLKPRSGSLFWQN